MRNKKVLLILSLAMLGGVGTHLAMNNSAAMKAEAATYAWHAYDGTTDALNKSTGSTMGSAITIDCPAINGASFTIGKSMKYFNAASFSYNSYNGTSYSYGLEYSGTPSGDRSLEFVIPEGYTADVNIVWAAGGSNRSLGIGTSSAKEGYAIAGNASQKVKNSTAFLSAPDISNGTYYINCNGSQTYVYDVEIVLKSLVQKYNVSFYDGSTLLTNLSQEVVEGEKIDASRNYSLASTEEMEFVGWSTTPNNNAADVDVVSYVINENTSFYAVWLDLSLKQVASFEGFTIDENNDAIWNTQLEFDYDGTKDDEIFLEEIIANFPKTITAIDSNGTTLSTQINVSWRLDSTDSLVGTQTFIGDYNVPDGYASPIALKVKVSVTDVRETVTEVLDTLEFNVAEGVELSKALPNTLNVKTTLSESKEVGVTWNYNEDEMFIGQSSTITGTLDRVYSLSKDFADGLTAVVTIKAKKSQSEVAEDRYVAWDARDQEKAITEYNVDSEGNFIVISENGVKVTAQSTMVNGTTNAGGNAMQIIGQSDKSSRAMSWIKFEVPFDATLKVRAAADGSGNRSFCFTSSESYNANVIKTQSHNRGSGNAFNDDVAVVSVDVSAGTYYFWNTSGGNSSQVYEIVVDKLAVKNTYNFVAGETLMSKEGLPVQDGYEFAGWVNPNGVVESGKASIAGDYAPLYYKASINYDVRLTDEPGIKYCFEIEFINGDALDLTKLNVNLSLTATNTINVNNASYEYLGGVLRSNAVVVGWDAEKAASWKNIDVTASIEIISGENKVVSYTGAAMSANAIANKVLAENPSLEEDLSMYL